MAATPVNREEVVILTLPWVLKKVPTSPIIGDAAMTHMCRPPGAAVEQA
jgi:hypothetical protein